MAITIATDTGRPVNRPFVRLATATGSYYGVKPPRHLIDRVAQIWRVVDDCAYRVGVENPRSSQTTWVAIPEGADAIEQIRSRLEVFPREGWLIEPLNIPLGRYFARMARPFLQHNREFPQPFYEGMEFAHENASASTQIASLADRLRMCFQVVDPVKQNFEVFGAEFRNILLLGATEVEAQCKGILRANNYDSKDNKPWNTVDYVKVEAALRLGDYAVEFPQFPWLEPLAPFREWDPASPSKSLRWYNAYNNVKHDRELNASSATLINALEVVSAVVVLGVAQFGIGFVRAAARWKDLFQINQYPAWSIGDTHEVAFLKDAPECGNPVDYPFS